MSEETKEEKKRREDELALKVALTVNKLTVSQILESFNFRNVRFESNFMAGETYFNINMINGAQSYVGSSTLSSFSEQPLMASYNQPRELVLFNKPDDSSKESVK